MAKPVSIDSSSSLATFHRLFPTEEDCIRFLFTLRWPQGFVCPFCASHHPHFTCRRSLLCPHCGNRSSLTTGTLMHGTKKPIRQWLQAIWWFGLSPFDASAKELQRILGLSCYQTAWTWLQKLRLAMARADGEPCRGVVEIGCSPIAPAHERKERALVLMAAEVVVSLGLTHRIRMRHVAVLNERSLSLFLCDSVRKTSSLLTADRHVYSMLGDHAASFSLTLLEEESLSRLHDLSRQVETCLHSVHRGGVTGKHLQRYLDEFCFRKNAAALPGHEAVFKILLGGVLHGSHPWNRRAVQMPSSAGQGGGHE